MTGSKHRWLGLLAAGLGACAEDPVVPSGLDGESSEPVPPEAPAAPSSGAEGMSDAPAAMAAPTAAAPSSPAPSSPVPSNPAPSNPAPSNPAPSNPAPSSPAPPAEGAAPPDGPPVPVAGVAPTPPSSDGPADADDVTARVSPPGAEVFAEGQVLEVRLTLAAADLLQLDEHGDLEEYVPAGVRLTSAGGSPVELPAVGMRHKGNWTLHHCWDAFGGVRSYQGECAKLSIKLDFAEYDPEGRVDGLRHLNLHASTGDGSRLRELLAYRTFRDFGVDAPRAIPARVYVNDEPRGLYIAVEDVDGRYTRAHFPQGPDGNLYKEIWPNASFEDAEFALALQTNESVGDVSDMRAFAEAVSGSTLETFEAGVEPYLDLGVLLRYIAVDRALRNWDGITSFYEPRTPHNFYWYHDDGPEPRFHLIPWDMDDTYQSFDPYIHPEPPVSAPPIPDLNVRPAHCEPRPIWSADGSAGYMTPGRCDPLLDGLASRHWGRVVELGGELLAGPFAPAHQSALADAWAATIAPIVAEDPVLDVDGWQGAVAELHAILEDAAAGFEGFLAEGLLDEPVEE